MRSWIHSVKPLGDFKEAISPPSHAQPTSPPTLPPLFQALTDTSGDKTGPLATALALLFEPSPVLHDALVPALAARLQAGPLPPSYPALIDAALAVLAAWPAADKAAFVAGHPRIGEVHGLSALSAREQAARATPPAVLARLAHLNACYERVYPGLVYITFVNGRSRAEIKDEMEDKLGLEHSDSADEPSLESLASVEVGGEAWTSELERAVADVGRIAKSRLKTLGVEESPGELQHHALISKMLSVRAFSMIVWTGIGVYSINYERIYTVPLSDNDGIADADQGIQPGVYQVDAC